MLTGAQWAQELKGDKHWWVGRRKLEEIAASSIERQVRTGIPPALLRAEAHLAPSVLLQYIVGCRYTNHLALAEPSQQSSPTSCLVFNAVGYF